MEIIIKSIYGIMLIVLMATAIVFLICVIYAMFSGLLESIKNAKKNKIRDEKLKELQESLEKMLKNMQEDVDKAEKKKASKKKKTVDKKENKE